MPQTAEGFERMGCLWRTAQNNWRLQRNGSTAWTDVRQSVDESSLAPNSGCDRSCVRRRRGKLCCQKCLRSSSAQIQGWNRGKLSSYLTGIHASYLAYLGIAFDFSFVSWYKAESYWGVFDYNLQLLILLLSAKLIWSQGILFQFINCSVGYMYISN